MMIIEHIAGEPDREEMIQACIRCKILIIDMRGAMVEVGSGAPAFWPEGQVFKIGNGWTTKIGGNPSYPCRIGGCITQDMGHA